MSTWRDVKANREAEAAAATVARMTAELARVELELELLAEEFGEVRAAYNEHGARMLAAHKAGAGMRSVGDGIYQVEPQWEKVSQSALIEMRAVLAERDRLESEEVRLLAAMHPLERRRDQIRRGLEFWTPIAGTLTERLASPEAPRDSSGEEPAEGTPAGMVAAETERAEAAAAEQLSARSVEQSSPVSARDRLEAFRQRLAGW